MINTCLDHRFTTVLAFLAFALDMLNQDRSFFAIAFIDALAIFLYQSKPQSMSSYVISTSPSSVKSAFESIRRRQVLFNHFQSGRVDQVGEKGGYSMLLYKRFHIAIWSCHRALTATPLRISRRKTSRRRRWDWILHVCLLKLCFQLYFYDVTLSKS